MKLERERLSLFELEIVDVRLCSDLDALLLHELLVGLANEGLERFLPDRFPEFLANNGRRRLSGSEAGQSHRRGVTPRGFLLGLLHDLDRNRDLDVALDSFGRARGKLDFHVRNITDGESSVPALLLLFSGADPIEKKQTTFVRR